MFTDRILHECMSSPDTLLLIEPVKFQPSRSSEREGVLGTAANSHTNSKVLPGNWLEKQKQEIRFGVEERRKEPGEATRDPKIKGHTPLLCGELHEGRVRNCFSLEHAGFST